jgi:membrane protein DedA with SNARE-associated domain
MNVRSVIWVIALTLFLGGVGVPLPENPILLGGGYAIHKQISPPISSLCLWFLAILCGDLLLFAVAYWICTRPAISTRLRRYVGKRRLERYERALEYWGSLVLFLARFTFGLRAVAYIVAGAARYSWLRFMVVDGLGVAIQVLLFVGIGYYAGGRIEWARATGERITLLVSIFALFTILVTWLFSATMKRLSTRAPSNNPRLSENQKTRENK